MPCHGIDGLYSGHEVNIGYRPYRTTRPTAIRVACDPAAGTVVELRAGQGLGRQTVRNPDHDDLPPDRPPAGPGDAWIWVYARQQGGSGWIPSRTSSRGTARRDARARGRPGSTSSRG